MAQVVLKLMPRMRPNFQPFCVWQCGFNVCCQKYDLRYWFRFWGLFWAPALPLVANVCSGGQRANRLKAVEWAMCKYAMMFRLKWAKAAALGNKSEMRV